MKESPFVKLTRELTNDLADAMNSCGYDKKLLENTINVSKTFGDISCSVAFKISKLQPGNPNDIAANIANRLPKNELIKKVTIDKGYMNFIIDRGSFTKAAIDFAYSISQREPISNLGKKEKMIIEYPSVNPN
ncbi:MAG: hypothetical protein ACHQX1_03235, partial [Candidatus Micrarchaeales archaeon]